MSVIKKISNNLSNFYLNNKEERRLNLIRLFGWFFVTASVLSSMLTSYYYDELFKSPWFLYFTHLSNVLVMLYFNIWFLGYLSKNNWLLKLSQNQYFKMMTVISIWTTAVIYWIFLFIPVLIGNVYNYTSGEDHYSMFILWFILTIFMHGVNASFMWIDFRSNNHSTRKLNNEIYWISVWPIAYMIGAIIYANVFGGNAVYPFFDFKEYLGLSITVTILALPIWYLIIRFNKKKYNKLI